MAYLNNIYGNAAYCGASKGQLFGRKQTSATAADYLIIKTQAALAAVAVDALIAFDALVSTGAGITQLAITTNTIAANEQFRAMLLADIVFCQMAGRDWSHAVAADFTALALSVFAEWTEMLIGLVTP